MGRTSDALIGRDAELALASRRLDDAAAGHGGVLLITGEPGIGKSALALAVATRGMADGFAVSIGRALELSGAPPWLPIRPCLRSVGIANALLPSAEHEAYGLWEEVLAALSDSAQKAPILWVLEDLHAADVQTLELLLFLAHPLRALRVAIVITARAVDPLRAAGAGERLDRLARAAETIELGPLDVGAISGLITQTAGRVPAARMAELVERAGGHPLFALELARASFSGRASLPTTIVQVVQERLASLPVATRELLEHAAVLGRELTAATLGRLVDRLPAAIIDDLAPALRVRLIDELSPGRFQFSHALVRDAIHDALPAARRRLAHARAERVLAEQPDTLERLVLRAMHALEAGDAIDAALADATIARAIEALRTDGAWDRAYALARKNLELRRVNPSTVELLETARLAASAGLYAEYTRLARDAHAQATQEGAVSHIAEAALVLGSTLRPGIVDKQLVRALQDAIERLEADPSRDRALLCRVRARLGAALMPNEDYSIPVTLARAAVSEARAIGDAALLLEVLHVAASAMTDAVDPAETHALAAELYDRARSAGDAPLALRALTRRIVHAIALGKLEAFGAGLDELLSLAASIGHPAHVWRPLLVASMRATARGELAASEQLLADVGELASVSDDPALALSYHAHTAMRSVLLDEREGIEATRALYLRMLEGVGMQAGVRAMLLAHIAVRLEDEQQAAHELIPLLRVDLGPHDPFSLAVAAECAVLVGDRALQTRFLAELAPLRERWIPSGQVDFGFMGPLERVIGLLEAALGDGDAAVRSMTSARARCVRYGLRPWTARVDFELGRILIAQGKTNDARASLESALAEALALPLPLTATRATSLLAQLSAAVGGTAPALRGGATVPARAVVEPASPPARAVPTDVELVREGEVWRVAFAGKDALLRDSRGMHLLARLLAAPGERMHVLALASDEGVALTESDAGGAIDTSALKRYRARLAELDDELANAESFEDRSRVERLNAEREALLAELRRAVGLGGRLRKTGSVTERARVNVTRRLRDALGRIAEAHPELGAYLTQAVRTGTYCTFRP